MDSENLIAPSPPHRQFPRIKYCVQVATSLSVLQPLLAFLSSPAGQVYVAGIADSLGHLSLPPPHLSSHFLEARSHGVARTQGNGHVKISVSFPFSSYILHPSLNSFRYSYGIPNGGALAGVAGTRRSKRNPAAVDLSTPPPPEKATDR